MISSLAAFGPVPKGATGTDSGGVLFSSTPLRSAVGILFLAIVVFVLLRGGSSGGETGKRSGPPGKGSGQKPGGGFPKKH